MRKTLAVLLAAAFVAALPSMAAAKKMKRGKRQPVVTQQTDSSFIGAALHQIIVPLEVTLGGRR